MNFYLIIILFILAVVYSDDDQMVSESTVHGLVKPKELVVVIRNSHDRKSKTASQLIKSNLITESEKIDQELVHVLMLHEEWADPNAWTILPILKHLFLTYNNKAKWIFFSEDTTKIDLEGLLKVLGRYDEKKDLFLGHAIHDHEASIIHHFAFHQNPASFKFPDFDAGWALSIALLERAVERLEEKPPGMSFSIDVKHEVAMFFFDNEQGTRLTDVPEFCINKALKEDSCVSTVQYEEPSCGEVNSNDILIAVKTCEKFHNDRVPVVQKTVGVHAKNIRYYSDVEDENIPTEFIGVKNTESGHCQKLYNIIKRSTEWEQIKWLVVIDDDTIMNFKRLQKLLACYDPNEPILLGERYGYGVNYHYYGYSYPTGGGGMVLSHVGVAKLLESDCRCHSVDAPDDMWLGSCFRSITPMVHTNSFHQSKPSQYNKEFLSHRYLVSFHKHFYVDPMQVYRDLLAGEEDEGAKREKMKMKKQEL